MKSFLGNKTDIRFVLICLALILSTLLVYCQVSSHDFITFDDDLYVTENPEVMAGISLEGVCWAFSFSGKAYWHPLTWLSHMLDCELFGLNAGMHHLMNLFFHLLNTLLLFTVLKTMTGSYFRSGFVAALFALHPVNVDSVAWLAERKNLLSTFFWMLTILAYAGYIRKATISRYIVMFCLFVLGLLSKPMLVTLPFVFFLLDYWPLKRFHIVPISENLKKLKKSKIRFQYEGVAISRLILEKVPLIVLSVAVIIVSSLSIKFAGSSISTDVVPMALRIENAIVSYVMYLWKMIWPANLTGYYPYPYMVPFWQLIGSLGILGIISVLAVKNIFRAPYFIVGWLWFLGTLVPVSGIMQGGLWPQIAERWAYVPYIGIFISIAWGVPELVYNWRYRKIGLSIVSVLVLLVLMTITWRQAGYWKEGLTLFSHDILVNPNNIIAHAHLGEAYSGKGMHEDAILHYKIVLERRPNDWLTMHNIARAYNNLGETDKSIYYYSEAIKVEPDHTESHFKLGSLYAEQGEIDKAINHLTYVINHDPEHFRAYYNLGIVYARKGDMNKAIDCLSSSLKISPEDPETHNSLGVVLMNQGRTHDAIGHFKEALRLDSDFQEARNYLSAAMKVEKSLENEIVKLEGMLGTDNVKRTEILDKLSVLYSRKGENEKALGVLTELLVLHPENPKIYYNIACINAKEKNVEEAIEWLKRSVDKGFDDWDQLKQDTDLDSLRDASFYKELIEKIP